MSVSSIFGVYYILSRMKNRMNEFVMGFIIHWMVETKLFQWQLDPVLQDSIPCHNNQQVI